MAEVPISGIPNQWTGPNLPSNAIIPGSINGVTYRISGSYFNTGGGGGGSQQVYESIFEPNNPPEDPNSSAIFLYRNGDINTDTSGANIIYIWDVVNQNWKAVDGFTWSDNTPYQNVTPKFRLQKHYEVSVTGGSGYESFYIATYVAGALNNDESWVQQ